MCCYYLINEQRDAMIDSVEDFYRLYFVYEGQDVLYRYHTRKDMEGCNISFVCFRSEDIANNPMIDLCLFNFDYQFSGLGVMLLGFCFNCKARGITQTCSGCDIARYCSRECQKADGKKHKKFCQDIHPRKKLRPLLGFKEAMDASADESTDESDTD